MLQFQDSQESQASLEVEKQVGSQPCRVISQKPASQECIEDEGWKQVPAHNRKKAPLPPPHLLRIWQAGLAPPAPGMRLWN